MYVVYLGGGAQLTTTVPDPKVPLQVPPVKETQLRTPLGVAPMGIRGLRVTLMRKSRVSWGNGRVRVGWGKEGKAARGWVAGLWVVSWVGGLVDGLGSLGQEEV